MASWRFAKRLLVLMTLPMPLTVSLSIPLVWLEGVQELLVDVLQLLSPLALPLALPLEVCTDI